jgi:hypothetical protein
MTIYTKDGGVWKAATPYLKKNGTWTEPTQVWTKDAGIWKLVYQADTTPPPVPTLTLAFIDNRYLNVSVKPATSAVADLDKVRVLVSNTGYPATPFSSGYVSEADVTYPNEPWSDFLFNATGAHSDTTATYMKEWPLNPGSTRALTGGATYYFSAFSVDKRGNWSAGAFAQFKAPDRTGGDPGTPIPVTTKVTEFPATFSGSYYGTDALRWSGVYLYQGYWASADGAQESIVGFNSAAIVSALKTAKTITKVELYMYCRQAYNPSTGMLLRYGFHDAAALPGSIATLNRFGVLQNNLFHSADGHWIDITSMSTSVWKSGIAKGMFFQPNTFDRHYSGLFDGHTQAHPPKLRITYTV